MSTTGQLQTFNAFDLAWAAGFIDGEGCIALVRHKQVLKDTEYQCFVLRLSVTNTDIRCLERLKAMFGGSISKSNRKSRPNHKPCWTWYCQSAKAQSAIERLLPYLLSKREQAEIGILARRHIQKNGVRRSDESTSAQVIFYHQLRKMKKAV